MASSPGRFPFAAFLIGGFLNLFVPSGGGEWAVVGQPVVEAAKTVAANAGMTVDVTQAYIAKVAMAVGYGDSWTNMIQPFWTLTFLPIIGAGSRLQARDIMGYTFVALLWSFVIFGLGVTFLPMYPFSIAPGGFPMPPRHALSSHGRPHRTTSQVPSSIDPTPSMRLRVSGRKSAPSSPK